MDPRDVGRAYLGSVPMGLTMARKAGGAKELSAAVC